MKKGVLIIPVLVIIFALTACKKCDLFGTWKSVDTATNTTTTLRINNDGTFTYTDNATSLNGKYVFDDNTLTLNYFIMGGKKRIIMSIMKLEDKVLKVKTNVNKTEREITFKKISSP